MTRDFGAVHFERTFEQNRVRLTPEQRGATLLRHFEMELIHRDPGPNYATFVVGPSQPCLMRYRRQLFARGGGP